MLRDLATLGVAVGGLASLATGLILLVSLTGRVPVGLVAAFTGSAGLTVVSASVMMVSGLRHRREWGSPEGNGHRG